MSSPAQSRRGSPEPGQERERKRRRKVLSCYDCRRRKLQCDRVLPACGRCVKAGNAANCLYMDDQPSRESQQDPSIVDTMVRRDPEPQFKSMHATHNDMQSRLEYQDRRIKQLEAALAQAGHQSQHRLPLTPESVPGVEAQATVVDRESMCFRGRSFKTTFFGSTHPGAMIKYIPDLNLFTRDAFEKFPALQRLRADTHALDEKYGIEDGLQQQVRDDDVKALLPSKGEADELIHIYIDTYDPIYHIIHLPAFWKTYEEMWTDLAATSTHFVALVLLMMACVSCLSSEPMRYIASSSKARERSLTWIRGCEDWVGRQSQKHVTVVDFQIRCLLWLAKQTSARKFKRNWTEAGTLLRFCMSSGLHRNPDLIPKDTSALDKELRRRIWATAVDFELQASFDRGMVSAPWLLQSDSTGPGNYHDGDFSSTRLSAARPSSDFTPSSYLALANESLMLRSTLNAVLNNIRQSLSFDEVKQYTEEIESHIRSIPQWTDRRSDTPRALLALRLQQYLLVLHDRNLRHATTLTERSFSKTIILETALQIVELHKNLVAKGNFALELYSLDPVRVSVSIANLQSYIDPRLDLALSRSFDTLTPQLMLDNINLSRDRVLRFGRETRALWVTLTCDGLLKSIRHPEERARFMQESAEGVINPVYKVIACQDHPPPEARSTEATSVRLTNDVAYAADTTSAVDQFDPTLLDMDEIAEWTFQDWFTGSDFGGLYSSAHSGDVAPPA